MTTQAIKIGDWVKPAHGWMSGRGCKYGKVVGEATYSKFNIACWLVDTTEGEMKAELCPKEDLELWWTAEQVEEANHA